MNVNNKKKWLFSLIGFSLAWLPMMVDANAAQPTITIDVKSPESINYNQVDKFTRSIDKQSATHVTMDNNVLILSDKPITLADRAPTEYKPRTLADLGIKISMNNNAAGHSVTKIPDFSLASNDLRVVPTIPDMIKVQAAQVQVNSAPATLDKQVAPAPIATAPVSKKIITPEATKASSMYYQLSVIPGALILFGGLMMLFGMRRSVVHPDKSSVYSGVTAENEMVGKGELFDFNGKLVKGKVTPINTTYLDLLWRVGKFSKEGSMNTYFYMVYYIPPQQAYAQQLKKAVQVKEESHSDS